MKINNILCFAATCCAVFGQYCNAQVNIEIRSNKCFAEYNNQSKVFKNVYALNYGIKNFTNGHFYYQISNNYTK